MGRFGLRVAVIGFWVCSVGCSQIAPLDEPYAKEPSAVPQQREQGTAHTEQPVKTAYEAEPTQPSVVSYDDYSDPLEKINRPIFKFNHFLYRYALTPISKGYKKVIPKPARSGVSNAFGNLREPLNFVNHVFQFEFKNSGKNLVRFGVNSTVGVLGLFDPASEWLEVDDTDATFADTLGHYGVGYGAYIVLPVLGPSDLRGSTDYVFDYFAHPLNHIDDKQTGKTLLIYEGFHDKVPLLEKYPNVVIGQKKQESEEKNMDNVDVDKAYEFVRNLHLQRLLRDDDYGQ